MIICPSDLSWNYDKGSDIRPNLDKDLTSSVRCRYPIRFTTSGSLHEEDDQF